MKINMTDTYQTRNGNQVRILCVDKNSTPYPVIALIGEEEELNSYTSEGVYSTSGEESSWDLLPVLKEYWVNLYYSGNHAYYYSTKEEADKAATPYRVACLRFKKGEGL